ncbi:MAG: DUF4097 family beta strand repeat protein [Firmicutes bacterium]|nr:DUF4097 family beta strand repeat protein [Bacillota bacterium]
MSNNTAKVIIIAVIVIAVIVGAWFGLRAILNGIAGWFSDRGERADRPGVFEWFSRHVDTEFETVTYKPGDSFDSVEVYGVDCDVRFEKSDDGKCVVECPECEGVTHKVEVSDGILRVERLIDRKVYGHLHIIWKNEAIVVRLPKESYERLTVENSSGNVSVPAGFSFENARAACTSGDIAFGAAVKESLELKATSGDIAVRDTDCEDLKAETSSGGISMSGCKADDIEAGSTSGGIWMENCTGREIGLSCTSGDVVLKACDGEDISIACTSGDVTAELLSGKEFSCRATSGDVDVPESVRGGGRCSISTTSGDIEVRIVK